ncbi:MAG TPA: hypothetical protein VH573_05705 [Mycobacteriales bacterium]
MTSWGVTAAERAAPLPCDELVPGDVMVLDRAVDVTAPAALTFRWLCQLRVAPYSYDLIDNRGRRSPRTLTPGSDRLEVGQRMCRIFTLDSFVPGSSLTLRLTSARGRRAFGDVAITYAVVPTGPGTSRIVARVRAGGLDPIRRQALGWGDLIMMRKQLRTFAGLAARTAAEG